MTYCPIDRNNFVHASFSWIEIFNELVYLFINRFTADDFYIFDESDSHDSHDLHDTHDINELNKSSDYEVITNHPDAPNMMILKPKNQNILPSSYKIPIILKNKMDSRINDTISITITIDGNSKNVSYDAEEKLQKNMNMLKENPMYDSNNEITQVDQPNKIDEINKINEINFIIFQQAWNNEEFIDPNKNMCEVFDLCNTTDQLEFYINYVDKNKMNWNDALIHIKHWPDHNDDLDLLLLKMMFENKTEDFIFYTLNQYLLDKDYSDIYANNTIDTYMKKHEPYIELFAKYRRFFTDMDMNLEINNKKLNKQWLDEYSDKVLKGIYTYEDYNTLVYTKMISMGYSDNYIKFTIPFLDRELKSALFLMKKNS